MTSSPQSRRLLPVLVAALLSAPGLAAQGTLFADVSEELGVLFEHEDAAFSYAMGGGVAWFDADGDGDDDLLTTSSSARHKLFRRDADGFVDVTAGSHLDSSIGSSANIGVSCADFDQDGRVDVYFTNNGPNQLFRNLGGFAFEEVAGDLGVDDDRWSTSASWADFDGDGDLDLYVGNYIAGLNFPYHYGDANGLFVNRGPGASPQFVDEAAALGVDDTGVFGPSVPGYPYVSPEGQPTAGCALSVCTLDYDEDGDADLMVGNDFGLWVMPDRMWRNDTPPGGPLVFTDVTEETGFAQGKEYNMGIFGRDFDHDGDWDFYLTNLGDNLLLEDDGTGQYEDVAYQAGPVEGTNDAGDLLLTSWGIVWEDFDNDGWEDLFVVNGYIPAASFIANDNRAPNHLWHNRGDGTFERVDPAHSGLDDEGAGRGVGWSDANGDGLLDLYVMNNGAGGVAHPGDRCRLFMNEGNASALENHWVDLRLSARFGNREAIGTRVELVAEHLELKRQLLADPVFISSPTRQLHFGLGSLASVDSMRFHWPSGRQSEWIAVPADTVYRVVEPVVTIDTIGEPTWADGVFTLPYRVANAGAEEILTVGRVLVSKPDVGLQLASLWTTASVPAGSTADTEIHVAVSDDVHERIQGANLRQQVWFLAEDALDCRSVDFVMP